MKKKKRDWDEEIGEDIDQEEFREQLVEDDAISDAEEGFMQGYEEEWILAII